MMGADGSGCAHTVVVHSAAARLIRGLSTWSSRKTGSSGLRYPDNHRALASVRPLIIGQSRQSRLRLFWRARAIEVLELGTVARRGFRRQRHRPVEPVGTGARLQLGLARQLQPLHAATRIVGFLDAIAEW